MNLPLRSIPLRIAPARGGTPVNTIQLEIRQDGVGPGKTGMAVWNSALLLGRLLEAIVAANPNWLPTKRVVEVGCGAGLVSLMASKLGAKSVWATDGNPAAVSLTQSNFDLNEIPYTTTIDPLDDNVGSNSGCNNIVSVMQWGELQVPLEWMGQVDVIFGSDLTYNSGSWRVLAETMESLLSKTGIVIYLSLGHSGFNVRGEMDGFVNVAKQVGLIELSIRDNFPSLPTGISSLDALLQSVVLPSERPILAATGGAQVIVLCGR